MKPKFRENKVTEAAALFLKYRGGKMHHLKLMKLLYLAEREALVRWGRPIVYDSYVSMKLGPVLSQTYSLFMGESRESGIWGKAISSPSNYEVTILEDPGVKSLSKAEEELIKEIFEKYGSMDRWSISDLSHDLPEWEDPNGSTIQIEYKDILQGAGKTPVEIASIISDIENIALMDSLTEQ